MISSSEDKKCPFSRDASPQNDYTVQFEELPRRPFLLELLSCIREYASRIGFSSLRNAWHTYSRRDFNCLFSRICKYGERISDFKTPIGTQYVITDPAILQLVLSQYRNQEGGLFCVPENEKIFIDGLVKDLYPEEMSKITDREKEVISAVIFTAESAHISSLRSRISGFLKQKTVQEYKDQLNQIAGEIFDQLTPLEKQSCDPAKLVFEYAIAVIGKLFTGYHATRQDYQKTVTALMAIGKHISDRITQHPPTEQDSMEYRNALQTMRELIENNMQAVPTPVLIAELRENGFSEFAIKMYQFFFYIAGTETTSAVTHYLVLQLGRNENRQYQEMIRTEGENSVILKKSVIEALRLNPPVFIIGRALRRDVSVTMRDGNKKVVWSKHLRKGHYIVNWVAGAARNPDLYPQPDAFNPLRYDTIPTRLPWLPFTTGHHTCPGQFLAKAEMESFIWEMLLRFNIQNIPSTGLIESRGTFTLHADPDGKIRIRLDEAAAKQSKQSNIACGMSQEEHCQIT